MVFKNTGRKFKNTMRRVGTIVGKAGNVVKTIIGTVDGISGGALSKAISSDPRGALLLQGGNRVATK